VLAAERQAAMAGRLLNRRVLREQAESAETAAAVAERPDAAVVVKKAKKAAAPRVRKPRAKKAPPRMVARWGVFDGSMKQVAVFDYNQRAAADEKLADLLQKKKSHHFIQIVKELMALPAPEEPVV